ncbi:LysR family transcriptional regulator [Sporolactobacillus vineae]|uniref:LysR family transcriptional regulator n=1 Tax=Sporolactobacillus vineae TaxID=444463 RepID=UPI000288142A|nr:LysR family transcriptional regulator [Sporolactobacillus vineae]
MTTDQLEAFLAVAEYKSYRAAAEKLFISQPSLSSRIQVLERELGTSLFNRNGRGVVLSEQGRIFIPYAKRMRRVYQKAQSDLRLNSNGC